MLIIYDMYTYGAVDSWVQDQNDLYSKYLY